MKVFSKTHVGLIRENNEDALLVQEPKLFAVADGMGGSNAGEVASKNAIRVFRTSFEQKIEMEQSVACALRKAVDGANSHVYYMSTDRPEYSGMGTTLTALYFENSTTAYVAQVGDSRLYRWRDDCLTQITQDQTMVGELLAAGKITKEEASKHPKKNMLTQALGVGPDVEAEITKLDISPQDRYLICSDGLSNMLSEQELITGLKEKDLNRCGEWLLERALQNGGKDNISLILIGELDKEDAHGADN